MTLLEKLHIEESGYRLEVAKIVSAISDDGGIYGRQLGDLSSEAKDRVGNHEWFADDAFHGAIYGEIVQYSNADAAQVCNYELESDYQDALETMAQEAMAADAIDELRDHHERFEDSGAEA